MNESVVHVTRLKDLSFRDWDISFEKVKMANPFSRKHDA